MKKRREKGCAWGRRREKGWSEARKGSVRSKLRLRGVLVVEAERWRRERGMIGGRSSNKSLKVSTYVIDSKYVTKIPIVFSLIKLSAYFTCFSLTTVDLYFFMNLNWFKLHVQNSWISDSRLAHEWGPLISVMKISRNVFVVINKVYRR